MPPRLKLLDLKYDGTGDPAEYLETYKSWMELNSTTNAFQCQAFVITLIGIARPWFRTLRPGSIFSFHQLSDSFVSQFAVNKVQRKPAQHIYTIRQKDNESTEAFLNRFVKEEMSVKDCNDSTACGALMAGLRSVTVLKYMISVKEDISYPELISKVRRHIQDEKTSDLEASKLSQDFLLGGKRKIDSQDEIERLIQRCQLRNYVRGNNQQPCPQAQENQQPAQEGEDIEVRTIIGGPAMGDTNQARKNYARQTRSALYPQQINLAGHRDKIPRLSNEPIIFTEGEASGLWHPHKDAIVVSLRIASRKVYKILIDNGTKFEPIKSALYGFTGDSVSSEGVLNLPIELGTHPFQHIQSVNFVVVDCPSSYNAIIGRPNLNAIRTVTLTYHLLVKFQTVGGIGVLKGDQQESRDIYEAANRPSNVHRVNIIEAPGSEVTTHPPATIMIGNIEVKLNQVRKFDELDPREPAMEQHGEPVEELEEIPLFEDDLTKTCKIGSSLTGQLRTDLINFLRDHRDVFAWSHEDMPGIDPKVIVHRLNIDPAFDL
ncbi:hypothetical protein UlMin_000655 [Ulmus minor]